MMKKIICILIIITILPSLYAKNINESVRIKLKDGTKITIQILCCGKKGLIAWNSNIFYKPELLEEYAEYISYNDIKYIQTKNKLSIVPIMLGLVAGSALAAGQFSIESETSEGSFFQTISGILLFLTSTAAGVIGSAASVLIPRHHKPKSFSQKYITDNQYLVYPTNLPVEIEALLQQYED
ncbi:MAG: hypothetical protein HQ534_13695 [Armatimonadetes bacterium]|nr:hypothetical protein [Armatimonadota bacterium]